VGDTALQTRLTREKLASSGGGGVKTGATAVWLVLASGNPLIGQSARYS
jgi:hypothetical protein